ncbi:MAG: exosortase/archaeosortase family protein [Candidatus Synoicihabitans palmerolidicus]|nr:exosortase/archaeosortase family protein [Candidatus Synoicihabitans palmerolidicus]
MLVACWAPLVWRWRYAWNLDPDLGHGWAVPFLALYLVWQSAASWSGAHYPTRRELRGGLILWSTGLAGAFLTVPVLEANPLWPTVQWIGAGWAMLGSLGALMVWRGKSAVVRFVIPVLFMHTAIAWPALVRVPVVTTLMQTNAEIAAELLSLFGQPAVVRGNIIEVDTGFIGVDDACSGMR